MPLTMADEGDFYVGGFDFAPGSVIVNFRIGGMPYSDLDPVLLRRSEALSNLVTSLRNANGLMYDLYEVDMNSISMNCKSPNF